MNILFSVFRLHGSLTQQERSAIFKAFREAKSGVLLTTVSTKQFIHLFALDFLGIDTNQLHGNCFMYC